MDSIHATVHMPMTPQSPSLHTPVLLGETLELLAPKQGESVLDVTVGLGGHSKAFLENIGPRGSLTALDADSENLTIAQQNLSGFTDNVQWHHSNFREIPSLNFLPFDVIFADLGLSSPHLDEAERGFSFRLEGPLDLRFDRLKGLTAVEFIGQSTEDDVADVLYHYGELKTSRKIARALKETLPETTVQLRTCIEELFGEFPAKKVLPQIFQALRIAVNDELQALSVLLHEAPMLLKPGGRLGIISFHSLEDRMVKKVFRDLVTPEKDPITGKASSEPEYILLTKKPVCPSEKEVEDNPRSRSAKLRVLQKKA